MGKFDIFIGRNSQYYWHLKASNGEIICQSEGYVSKQGVQNGIEACKRYAPNAPIKDLT